MDGPIDRAEPIDRPYRRGLTAHFARWSPNTEAMPALSTAAEPMTPADHAQAPHCGSCAAPEPIARWRAPADALVGAAPRSAAVFAPA